VQPFGEQLALFIAEWHVDDYVRCEVRPPVRALGHAGNPFMT
jgi:hypothetical protein